MASKANIIWSLKEITELLRQRQLNKFDANIGVSGKRGNGKSTVIFKLLNSYKKTGFNQRKHQVYKRDDVIDLLCNQQFSFCWDDEAINSGYKRDFQNRAQNDLIKIITNYRDNFNIYCSALPFFYTLDKGLRELIFLHIHVIERGFAVILMPLEDPIHSQDPWDTDVNKKIEVKENRRMEKNPELKFRYHKLSTFAGYIYFGDMTNKQRNLYEKIKKEKRGQSMEENNIKKTEKPPFIDRIFTILKEGKLSRDGLIQSCVIEGQKYSTVVDAIGKRLRDAGENKTITAFLRENSKSSINNTSNAQIDSLVPDFT